MRPPILFLTVAFGVGLWAGLDPFVFPGRALPGGALWIVALPVVALAAWLARRAALGAAGRLHGRGGKAMWSGAQAPIVTALVFAPNARLDSDIRERYVRSGLAHLLSISGLHVGFIAAWLALILGKLRLAARARFGATAVLLLGYLWLLGFPAPAMRAGAMLVLADVAHLRERVVAPRGVVALAALRMLLPDAS